MADIAFSAVNQVLGIIREEVKLQRGVRSDVKFIMDEMESMNDMLSHLVKAQRKAGGYQFRPWMKQVLELAFDSKNCVVPYMESRGSPEDDEVEGLAARLRRVSWLPWAMIARRRVATQIQELKVRASIISERHARYATALLPPVPQSSAAGEPTQEHDAKRRAPVPRGTDMLAETTEELIKWLDAKPATATADSATASSSQSQSKEGKASADSAGASSSQSQSKDGKASADTAGASSSQSRSQSKDGKASADSAAASSSQSQSKDGKGQLKVVAIHSQSQEDADGAAVAESVYEHYRTSGTTGSFELVLRVSIPRPPLPMDVLLAMLYEINPSENPETWKEEDGAKEVLRRYMKSKKLLLVVSKLDYPEIWNMIKEVLESSGCADGSAVVALFYGDDTWVADVSQPNRRDAISLASEKPTATNWEFFHGFSPNLWKDDDPSAGLARSPPASFSTFLQPEKTVTYSLVEFYLKKAVGTVPSTYGKEKEQQRKRAIMKDVLTKCSGNVQLMSLFLHALDSYPGMPEQELKILSEKLDGEQASTEKENILIAFCYEALPNWCKNCLWYATVTRGSSDAKLRRTGLVRRWVAEDLTSTDKQAEELAERCFQVLLARKFLHPHDVGGAGTIKSCSLDQQVTDMIVKDSPTVEDLLLNNQIPLDRLDLLFSLRTGVQLHRSSSSLMSSMRSLPTSSRILLKVLDLEGQKGLRQHDLRNICRQSKLKYLSIRNTDVAQLPKEIDQLTVLETLDIRETRVKALDVVLPKLRHLLAGLIECPKEDTVRSKESFSTVHMPRGIEAMERLEILSHVKVSDSAKELNKLGDKLKKLKKLGVALSGNKAHLEDLFTQIDKFHGCLLSLSIRMEQPASWDRIDAILLRPPRSLRSLNICNIRSGLPPRIKELHQLTKITLRDTFLNDNALDILGTLQHLRCLRLRYHSFAEGALTFTGGKFNRLMVLEIEDGVISRITFNFGSANKLEKMVWSFNHMEYLSGIGNLLKLKRFERNAGTYDDNSLQELNKDITVHPNKHELIVVENGQVLKHHHAAR